jgi:hypothetical protein
MQKKIENNRVIRHFNADLALEENAIVIEHKKKIDLETVIYNIKERYLTGSGDAKKFKRDTSVDEEEEQYSLVPYCC